MEIRSTCTRGGKPALIALTAMLLTGCAGFTFTGGPDFDLTGNWTGGVALEGENLEGNLEIDQSNEDLRATFTAAGVGLMSRGNGTVEEDGSFTLTMSYDVECTGTARLDGRFSADPDRLTGSFTATDCTGEASGTFDFRRRGGGAGEEGPRAR